MKHVQILDELNTIAACQKAVADLLGRANDGLCPISNLAVLLDYLQAQQEKALDELHK